MANFPTSPATGTIFSTAQNVYKYNGTAWEIISPNISLGYPEMTGSFIDLSGSLPNLVNVGASTISNITASVLHLDGTFSSGSNIAISITGSAVKLKVSSSGIPGTSPVLKIENKYNNILKEYTINITGSSA